jgi:hypothetical protein
MKSTWARVLLPLVAARFPLKTFKPSPTLRAQDEDKVSESQRWRDDVRDGHWQRPGLPHPVSGSAPVCLTRSLGVANRDDGPVPPGGCGYKTQARPEAAFLAQGALSHVGATIGRSPGRTHPGAREIVRAVLSSDPQIETTAREAQRGGRYTPKGRQRAALRVEGWSTESVCTGDVQWPLRLVLDDHVDLRRGAAPNQLRKARQFPMARERAKFDRVASVDLKSAPTREGKGQPAEMALEIAERPSATRIVEREVHRAMDRQRNMQPAQAEVQGRRAREMIDVESPQDAARGHDSGHQRRNRYPPSIVTPYVLEHAFQNKPETKVHAPSATLATTRVRSCVCPGKQ